MRLRTAIAVLLAFAGGSSRAAQDPWARHADTTEHAFTVDVPHGWQVSGGVVRRSPMQPHVVLTLRSPGGKTELLLGNAEAFTYSVPTPTGRQLGFREGSLYSPGTDKLLVRSYRTGKDFAVQYARQRLPRECRNVKALLSRDRPDKAYRSSAYGLQFSGTAGDAFYTCERDGHGYEAYVFSSTELVGQPQVAGGIWNAEYTYLFVTPQGQGMAAGAVLAHVVGSFRFDPKWLAAQLQVSRDAAGKAIADANARLDANAATMRSTFAETPRESSAQKAAAANQEEMGRLMSGFDRYETASGEKRDVPYGAATNWWSNGRGQVRGTQGPRAPSIDMQEMKRVPAGK